MATELLILISLLIIALIILLRILNGYSNTTLKYLNLPPGKLGGWPLIGDTIPFMQPHLSSSLGPFLNQHIAKYGRIFKMNLMGKPTIVSADPELTRFILHNEGRLFLNSTTKTMREIMGRWSLLSITEDELHKEMRSIATDFINKIRNCFFKDVDVQVAKVFDSWEDNCTLYAVEEVRKFAFIVMVKNMMSVDAGTSEMEILSNEYASFMKGMASIPLNLPGTHYRKALQSRSTILKIIGRKLDEKLEKMEGHQGLEEDDLLASVLKHPHLTREQILDFILGILFAGHETTSCAINLAIYFVHLYPDVLQQLREEHVEIMKQKKERGETGLNWDDYKQMEFTRCVIHESLRLGNIVKFLYREAIRDVKFKGYDIPCGWQVVPILSATHLDPSNFDDPQSFNPWRWQQSTTTGVAKMNMNLMTFSSGSRSCTGAELAKLEISVFLHHFVTRFDWELAEHDYPVSFPFLGFTKKLPIKIRALKH